MSLACQKIIEVMRLITAIDKNRTNESQKYKFRGIDDVYNELHEHLAKVGLFTLPKVLSERTEDRTTRNGGALIYRVLTIKYEFYAEDGSCVEAIVIGEGMDSGDKASNKAMSVAHKYAFVQAFSIPTKDDKDAENESHQLIAKGQIHPDTLAEAVEKEIQRRKTEELRVEIERKKKIMRAFTTEFDRLDVEQDHRVGIMKAMHAKGMTEASQIEGYLVSVETQAAEAG